MTFAIRKADEADSAFIEHLFTLPHVLQFLNAPQRDDIVATFGHESVENYIIEASGERAGNLVLRNHGFLMDVSVVVAVEPRRGTGMFGLRFALRRAFDELKCHRVFLEAREDNAASRRLVERLGFVKACTGTDFKTLEPASFITSAHMACSHTSTDDAPCDPDAFEALSLDIQGGSADYRAAVLSDGIIQPRS